MIKYGQDRSFLPNFCSVRPLLLLIIFAELLAITIVLIRTPLSQFEWVSLALFSFYIQWVVLLSGFVICLLRRIDQYVAPSLLGIAGYLAILLCTAFVSYGAQCVLMSAHGGPVGGEVSWMSIIQPVLVSATVGGMLMRYWYLQWALQRQQRSELLHRIHALQARIRPHFLFNSMNILASLIGTRPKQAEQVVEDLADLFRVSLQVDKKEISISEELLLCERYVRIEQLRLGARLQVEWHLDKAQLSHVNIPPLTIQPIIENAINHGVQSTVEGGLVSIRVEQKNQQVVLLVENPYRETASDERHSGNQMALENIVHRLQALYGDKVQFTSGLVDQRYRTCLSYPDQSEHRRV